MTVRDVKDMCPWTSDEGQCGLDRDHEGDHLPVPGVPNPTVNGPGQWPVGSPMRSAAAREAHPANHEQTHANVVLYNDLNMPDGHSCSVVDLKLAVGAGSCTPVTQVKIQARPGREIRSVRYIKLVRNEDTGEDEVHIIGY